jgi:uncharacterized protein involved in exopolysaccharide biosynthesis
VTRYLEAFFRHKLLVITPVVLALVMSVWYVKSQPVTYQSSTSVWFDTPLPNPSSVDVPAQGSTPAQQAQLVLQELLGTRQFLINVGNRGPLRAYLATHHASKHGPTVVFSKLLSAVKGHSGARAPLDDQIAATLARAFSMTTTGPQVIDITMTSSAASAMPGTLKALVAEFTDEISGVRRDRDQAALSYEKTQLDFAERTLASADSDFLNYERDHPNATVVSDPALAELVQLASAAQNNYVGLQHDYNQAGLALTNAESANTIRVIDSPLGATAISHKKKAIFAGVAGLVLGLIISFLTITALVATDKTARVNEDIADVEGLEVVANIEHLRHARRTYPPSIGSASRSS